MFSIFLNIILPVFLVAGVSMLLYRWKKPSPATLSFTIINLFSPALVFTGMARTDLSGGSFFRFLGFILLLAILTLAIAWTVARTMRVDRNTESAMMLTATFMNVANLGIPVVTFAFGQQAMDKAVTFYVIQAVLTWTVGAFIAARGVGTGWGPVISAFKLPSIYAAILGTLVNILNVPVPGVIMRPLELMAQATVPVMLVILGFQLSGGAFQQRGALLASIAIRLLISTLIAFPLAIVLGIQGMDRNVAILMASMPPAVFTTILATEFKANPALTTSVVVFSTAASVITLTVIIRILQAMG